MSRIRFLFTCILLLAAAAFPALFLGGCEIVRPAIESRTPLGPATLLFKTGKAVSRSFEDITAEQEYYIGRAVAASILERYDPYDDPEANHYVNLVGQTLARASDRPETFGGYHFLIIDSPEINAFAAPGGFILVSRGMLRCSTSEDTLAAVLAHEIGHIEGQHGLKAIRTGRLATAFNVLAMESFKRLGSFELSQLTQAFEGSVNDIVSTLMNSGYSRDLEREADQAAIKILSRVGYNPAALVDMLDEMSKNLKPGGLDFAKTHPDPRDRRAAIEAQVQGLPSMPVPPARRERFDRAIGSV